jgi:hypothetical protein
MNTFNESTSSLYRSVCNLNNIAILPKINKEPDEKYCKMPWRKKGVLEALSEDVQKNLFCFL